MWIPHPKKNWGPLLPPALCYIWADKGGYFQKLYYASETSDMTSEGLGEMFEGDSVDTAVENFRSCGWGLSGGSSVHRPGSEDPHRRERKFPSLSMIFEKDSPSVELNFHNGRFTHVITVLNLEIYVILVKQYLRSDYSMSTVFEFTHMSGYKL